MCRKVPYGVYPVRREYALTKEISELIRIRKANVKSFFFMDYADKDRKIDPKVLTKFTLDGWAKKKDEDLQKASSDLKVTLAYNEDQLFAKALRCEEGAIKFLGQRAKYVPLPVRNYQPNKVSPGWLVDRLEELKRQRTELSTHLYHKWERKPESFSKSKANSIVQTLNWQIYHYEQLGTINWAGPQRAMQAYVENIEFYLLILEAGTHTLNKGMSNPQAKKLRIKLFGHYQRMRDLNEYKELGLRIWPWNSEFGNDMKWEEYKAIVDGEAFFIKGEKYGIPYIYEGTPFNIAKKTNIEEMAHKRREAIDNDMIEYRKKAFYVIKGWLSTEKIIWGRTLQAITQAKRWETWSTKIEG